MLERVYASLDLSACVVDGIVDRFPERRGNFCGYTIQSPDILQKVPFDAVIVTAKKWENIKEAYEKLGCPKERLLAFWSDDATDPPYFKFESKKRWKSEQQCQMWEMRARNAPFEYAATNDVKILSSASLLHKILATGCSLTRYGDGEFSIILQEERSWFQKPDGRLATRLREVLQTPQQGLLVAIADNYGNLDKYTERAADAIRAYQVSQQHRQRILQLLNRNQAYYNAYVSRPYLMYRDKEHAKTIFALWRKLFHGRNLLIVEGRYSRFGMRSDLLSDAASVRRILAPEQDAFHQYDRLLACVKSHVHQDDLVLLSLGPTATIMAAGIAGWGVQAIDIGQLDNEYDWYRLGVEVQVPIPGKMTAEAYSKDDFRPEEDDAYTQSVVARCF